MPWELAWIDKPFDAGAPNFLGAQANIGRWILDPSALRVPARSLHVSTMAVVWGVYAGPGMRRLTAAEQEAQQLQETYGAVSIEAQPEPVLALLSGRPPTDLLHFAVHGTYNPDSVSQGIYLVSGAPIDSLQVSGSDLSARTPFIFLNTVQISSAQSPLGDYGGMAQAFLRAGASGVLVAVWPIPDTDAQRVALEFYESVFKAAAQTDGRGTGGGQPAVADVLRRARAGKGADQDRMLSYLAYQFYGHPSFRLAMSPRS
jgi:hypothetical protein